MKVRLKSIKMLITKAFDISLYLAHEHINKICNIAIPEHCIQQKVGFDSNVLSNNVANLIPKTKIRSFGAMSLDFYKLYDTDENEIASIAINYMKNIKPFIFSYDSKCYLVNGTIIKEFEERFLQVFSLACQLIRLKN